MVVRRAAHSLGLRYRVDAAPLAGLRRSADLVFTRIRVAVFLDGCFWHGCPEHFKQPAGVNATYRREKIERNQTRDHTTDDLLAASGWTVLRFWEHQDAHACARSIRNVVSQRQ